MKGLFPSLANRLNMDTDRTQVKASHSDLPVPISAPSVPEAYQRAPTLMAGAGNGGQVRIWAPRKWSLRLGLGVAAVGVLWYLWVAITGHVHGHAGDFARFFIPG